MACNRRRYAVRRRKHAMRLCLPLPPAAPLGQQGSVWHAAARTRETRQARRTSGRSRCLVLRIFGWPRRSAPPLLCLSPLLASPAITNAKASRRRTRTRISALLPHLSPSSFCADKRHEPTRYLPRYLRATCLARRQRLPWFHLLPKRAKNTFPAAPPNTNGINIGLAPRVGAGTAYIRLYPQNFYLKSEIPLVKAVKHKTSYHVNMGEKRYRLVPAAHRGGGAGSCVAALYAALFTCPRCLFAHAHRTLRTSELLPSACAG